MLPRRASLSEYRSISWFRSIVRTTGSGDSNVRAVAELVREYFNEPVAHVLVEEQLHATELSRRRSQAAANASAARMSSRVRFGKSRRISSSAMPPARYSRTSYTVMRVPLIWVFRCERRDSPKSDHATSYADLTSHRHASTTSFAVVSDSVSALPLQSKYQLPPAAYLGARYQ